MIRNKLNFLFPIIVPNILLVVYSVCMDWADHYSSMRFDITYKLLVGFLGNVAIGLYFLWICKNALSKNNTDRLPWEYLLGFIFVPLFYVLFFLPMPLVIPYSFFGSSLSQYCIVATIHVGIFIHTMRNRAKTKQHDKG